MTVPRRRLLALTGAFLAGCAGAPMASEEQTESTPTETPGETPTETPSEPDSDKESGSEFDDLDAPPFPVVDPVTDPDVAEETLGEQIRGNVTFALDLGAVLRELEGGNLFYSPYSVSVALAMTYAGARGETREEMANALAYFLDGDELHGSFGSLETEFERRNEDGLESSGPMPEEDDDEDLGPAFELATANAAWGQEEYDFRDDFFDLLEAYYEAGLRLVDFAGDAEEARERINEWVAERTDDRIEELLGERDVDSMTRLVLTNAITFTARWEHDFDEEGTEPRPFTALDGTEREVPSMHQSTELQYAEIDGHQLVELPYDNGETSMVVILPAEGEFEAFEEALDVDRLATMLDQTSRMEVDLAFPKFGLESEFSLVEAMQELGMEQAFEDEADFTGMREAGGLFVADIVHQATLEVDELGTEAAAATAVVIAEASVPDHVEMTVDRPFLFYIRDQPTETPLFVGRVTELGD